MARLVATRARNAKELDQFVCKALGRSLAVGEKDGRIARFVMRFLAGASSDLSGQRARNPAWQALEYCLEVRSRCTAGGCVHAAANGLRSA